MTLALLVNSQRTTVICALIAHRVPFLRMDLSASHAVRATTRVQIPHFALSVPLVRVATVVSFVSSAPQIQLDHKVSRNACRVMLGWSLIRQAKAVYNVQILATFHNLARAVRRAVQENNPLATELVAALAHVA